MRNRHQESGRTPATVWALSLLLLWGGVCTAAENESPPAVADLIRLLSSNVQKERTRAQQQLAMRANTSPGELLEASKNADPETKARLRQLLEGVFLSCDDATGDQAERALMSMSDEGSTAAQSILTGNAKLRESRARTAIERLGGQLTYWHATNSNVPQVTAPIVGVGFGEPVLLRNILFPEDWTGTTDDLWHLDRFRHIQDLVVYNIRGNKLSSTEILPFTRQLMGIRLEERGACLGIHAVPGLPTARILDVVPESAAAEAGLRRNDDIIRLNGEPVRNFHHLVEILADYRAGDEIKMEVIRENEPREIVVKLASWKKMIAHEASTVPPPVPFAGPLGNSLPNPPPPSRPALPASGYQLENN